ncbi:MAG: cell division ATP-binding protein FtsE [Oscillospiraceae bacterium]|nr:cell division ATP-binding protein FtsE [Oscillospiraceae bacterium]
MIRFIDVEKNYDNGTHALKGVSFDIEEGEFVFLVGPSGSGKTTIIKLITAEITADRGRIEVNGYHMNTIRPREIPDLRATIGVVFQDFRLIEERTVYQNLSFVMKAVGASRRQIRKRIPYVLDLVDLKGKEKRHPSELSGGEQQRVAIARALVNNPSVIIADEPTGNLDPAMSLEIMNLLGRINELGTTVLVVTHEKELVNRLGKRVVYIQDGTLRSDRQEGFYGIE